MLLAVSVYPLLIGIGISGVAAAAVIGSVLVISYAPSSAIAVLSAHTAGVDPMTYLIQYQLPVAIPAILVTAVVHVIVQNYLDKRDKATGSSSRSTRRWWRKDPPRGEPPRVLCAPPACAACPSLHL